MSIETLIQSYGYLAVFLGTLLEGEAIVILAAFAAHQGYVSLSEVILAAFAGGCLGDQFYFFLGRYQGKAFLRRRPAWKDRVEAADRLVERFHIWVILAIRYLYGLRSVLCFALGMSCVSGWTFALLNAVGVAVWALLMGLGGYYLGYALEALLKDIKKYELAAAAAIVAVSLAIWAFRRYRQPKP